MSRSDEQRERFFHVHRRARDAYGFSDAFFSIRGDVVFANHYQAHQFVEAIKRRKDVAERDRLRASELHAMGLLHELYHAVIGAYKARVRPEMFSSLLGALERELGGDLDRTLRIFVEQFPPPAVYKGEITAEQFLHGSSDGVSNREWILEELILLWVSNQNPSYAPIRELIGDDELRTSSRYLPIVEAATEIFDAGPRLGSDNLGLMQLLLDPARRGGASISAQLEWVRSRWGVELIGEGAAGRLRISSDAWNKLLAGIDFIHEEGLWFQRKGIGPGGGENLIPQSFKGELYEAEPEKFSEDLDWMPRVVMIAKSTFVWLDQLARTYRRNVRYLSDIPDEELAALAARGFTALWLIGVWRRSAASQRIKQIQGNREAIASAYSLYDYEIAPELGGEAAYRNLEERARRVGIRLASDMVPNHMGIDSRWVIEHPERFVQSDHAPFPNYTFNGPDLSSDGRVGIFIEDGYWRRSDAAVVFKRLDRYTGQVKYIYHGNDGTTMPWNDTAQLDYLRADVREAVMQTILHVARKFPIIRFDAAMTLAKKHYQRLWFPLPGTGGAIPSRAEHAMTRERFDELFPAEFWREVVDRVAAEVPNTLLLAEAFWLMEGYFVRTLGMHRVYNSAFMNMLKKEDNASFRLSVKNVLEFNPQILKRHVNFMNNPDEEPAVVQFGKDDKYFGVCTMLATMPGLPMFGHGQVEGFVEKYGMEYLRATMDERPDGWLVGRHEREIFPLLRNRRLFSDVENFYLFDFFAADGPVDEDVFAYSNRLGEERAVVVYHNKFKQARGWIRVSAGYLGADGKIVQRSLGEALGIGRGVDRFLVFRDHVTGLEHIRGNERIWEEGLYFELDAFKYRVLWNMREVVESAERPYGELETHLAGAGVPSIDDAVIEYRLRPILEPYWEAINPGSARYLVSEGDTRVLEEKLEHIVEGLAYYLQSNAFEAPYESYELLARRFQAALPFLRAQPERAHVFLAWLYTDCLAGLRPGEMQEWQLERVMRRAFQDAGAPALVTLLTKIAPRAIRAGSTERHAEARTGSTAPDRATYAGPVQSGGTRTSSAERGDAIDASSEERNNAARAPSPERGDAIGASSEERNNAARAPSPEHDNATRARSPQHDNAALARGTERDRATQAASAERKAATQPRAAERGRASDVGAAERDSAPHDGSAEHGNATHDASGPRGSATHAGSTEHDRVTHDASGARGSPTSAGSPERDSATSRGFAADPAATILSLLADTDVRAFLEVHSYDNIVWYKKERFEDLIRTLALIAASDSRDEQAARKLLDTAEALVATAAATGYRLADLESRLATTQLT